MSSFSERLKSQLNATMNNTPLVSTKVRAVSEIQDEEFIATAETWTRSGKYDWYDEFADENISTVDEYKNIKLDDKQINLSQESYSQFIPFKMPRRYDGFDLATRTEIYFHYMTEQVDENGKRKGDHIKAVNVQYDEVSLKFGLLVPPEMVAYPGDIEFEIEAIGTVQGKAYKWISKTNKFKVLASLCALGELAEINPTDPDWFTTAVLSAQEARDAAEEAKGYLTEIEQVVDNAAEAIVGDIANILSDTYYTKEQINSELETKSNIGHEHVLADITDYKEPDFTGYATETFVKEEIEKVDVSEQLKDYALRSEIPENISAFANDVGYLTEHQSLEGYATETFVTEAIEDSKVGYATETFVKEEIEKVDVSEQLGNYYTKDETYNRTEIDTAIENVEVDLTGYATEKFVTDRTNPLETSVSTNTGSISSLSTALGELQAEVSAIDTSPRLTYDVVYNDAEDPDVGENVFVFYEIENEGKEDEKREAKKKFTITGGSSGGSASMLKIAYVTKSPVITTVNDKVLITYNFSGKDSSGDDVAEGRYTWKIGSKIIASGIATNGDNTFDATDFATTTSQKFTLTITDDGGSLVTKSWTVQKVDVRLESNFNDAYQYNGDVSFNYTPYGAIEKDVHFVLDGKELGTVKTSTSGIPTSYTIPSQTHGSHLLEVYMTATINNILVESNHIYKDIVWFDKGSLIPVIGCATPIINVTQYNTVNIKYAVIDPNTETPKVTWYLGEEIISEETLTEKDAYGYYTYSYKANNEGTFVFTITCGDADPKVITMNVEKLNIDVSPVTAGLEFDFNPVGYSNNSANKLWSYNDVTMTVSDNFDWVNGGYQIDENGDQYFCVKAGTNAVINYNLFADDPKKNGKEFKAIFKTKNIRKRDTSFLNCLDDGIGLDMKVEHATVYDSAGSLKTHYCENEIIEYEFNINKYTDMMIVMSYEDGTPNIPYEYKETSSFKQTTPQPITIGSADCDVHIYRMKAYSISLTDTDIKNNFIADARDADEMIARYNRNSIYNENGGLVSTSASGDFSVDALMKAAPDLRYIFLEVPQFTNDKDNKIDGCTVYFRYPNGTRPQDNWDCTGVRHRGQGTSSNLYGYAGRNIDLCMDRDESLFTYTDEEGNTVESSTITLTDTSYPTDYLNIKVNIASSENANNAQLARRFNEYQPFLRYARKKDSRIKDTMEFYNCVVFIRETSTDPSVPHREFNDTNWHFYAIGNVGDSKKTDDTRVNNKRDPKEHVVEITDADKPLSAFPTGKEGHAVCPISEWKSGNTAYDVLYSNEYVYDEEGAFESFGGTTYEFRYEMKDITAEQRQVNIDTWRDLYTFIATSTDEEFYANLKNYFVVDSALYYYLFTERYTMVDNRAKNSFWHYGKVYISNAEAATLGETEASYYIIDDEAAAINDGYRYDLTFGYDMDTALGIDNTGDFVFPYGKEDTDYYVDGDPSSDYVFRVADSVFFCRLRDLFPSELQAMFKNREEKNAWDSNSLINQWDNAQVQFPEELWRLDYERKYYRTYLGLSIDNSITNGIDKTFLIGKFFGRKKYARRSFEINQEMYFATKYFGNKALSDVFWMRGGIYAGSNNNLKQNYSLTLVPYSDMYVCVQYTSTGTPMHKKAKAGQTVVFENDSERMDFIYVYGASFIQEVGDLSRCYIGDNNFSSAIRLQKLVIGSTDEGYENIFMKQAMIDNNPLLEHLDLRNVSGVETIDVSKCSNLKELYAEGTSAKDVIFANGGLLEIAHLPRISSLSIKNLNNIKDFVVDGYDNLQTLIVENTPNINTYNIVNSAPLLKTARLVGLNWDTTYEIKDGSVFDRLLTIGGIDSSGVYETDVSVLTGNAHVTVIKQKQLSDYDKAWSDLDVTYNTLILQYPVTFVNHDGTILDVQYVDKGSDAVDPISRAENPIPTPTKESSVSHDFTFAGWDSSFTGIFADREIKATYSSSLREYTVKYVSKGTTLQESKGLYGDNILYTGDTPVYTYEESAYVYHLFNRWDKSGFVDGDKTIEAVFDRCEYSEGYFNNKELSELSPVEIYAMTKLGLEQSVITDKDSYSFSLGHDYDFDDIESELIVSEKMTFNGSNQFDTGIKLFDIDKDFVLAIDYKFLTGTNTDSVLAQCFQSNGRNGFQLKYNNGANLVWGTTPRNIATIDNREMVVIRHKKGDTNLTIYTSNLSGASISTYEISGSKSFTSTSTLVFGCVKADDGIFESHAVGEINWAKLWLADLGDEACQKLALWTHENLTMEACGFRKYYLTENESKRCSFSLLASHLLDRKVVFSNNSTNTGGWASSTLNTFLNTRLYAALPLQMSQLIKQVKVASSIGNKSSEVSYSDCYITIPAVKELDPTMTSEPYNSEASAISYMTSDSMRMRAYDGGNYDDYWTRSPNVGYTNYIYQVNEKGELYGFCTPTVKAGILIQISI